MVRLIVSARLQACLQKLVDHQRHELPLELLDLIQDNLQRILTQSGAARWIDHSVLARIGRWNRQSASMVHISMTGAMQADEPQVRVMNTRWRH